MYWGVGNDIVR